MKHWISALLFTALSATSWGSSCSINVIDAALGSYDPLVNTAGITVMGQLPVTCPKGTTLMISAAASQVTNSINVRQMRNSRSNTINYQLYTDVKRSIIFGNGSAGNQKLSATSTGGLQIVYFYVHVPGQQFVGGGIYEDFVSITIEP